MSFNVVSLCVQLADLQHFISIHTYWLLHRHETYDYLNVEIK